MPIARLISLCQEPGSLSSKTSICTRVTNTNIYLVNGIWTIQSLRLVYIGIEPRWKCIHVRIKEELVKLINDSTQVI